MRIALAAMLMTLPLQAQTAGEIRGIAWSAQGRPISGAKIYIEGPSKQTVTSGPGGYFVASKLSPGRYQITASDQRLQTISESPMALDVAAGTVAHADVTLGKSTKHYGFFKRIGRRLTGQT